MCSRDRAVIPWSRITGFVDVEHLFAQGMAHYTGEGGTFSLLEAVKCFVAGM